MRGPCKWIWSHLNMHYSSLETQTEMRLCCWPAFIGPCLLKLYSERSNKQEGRGSGRVRRTIWESHTSVNKPKRLQVKKECFREWFLQILDPRVAYPWVICNPPPHHHHTVKAVSDGKKLLNGHLKNETSRNMQCWFFTPIHTDTHIGCSGHAVNVKCERRGRVTVKQTERCLHGWFWLHTGAENKMQF